MVALAHGTNDAQKTMGVISLALIANGIDHGRRRTSTCPTWVVVSCATAIALGTYSGGWRIIKTLGTKVVEVRPPQGFGSETVAASVILASSHVGFPLSTTQVVSGAVAGSGVGRPGAVVNWLVARNIVVGWLLTLPAAAAVAAVVYAIIELLGGGAFGTDRRRRRARHRLRSCSGAPTAPSRSTPEETVSENPAFGRAPTRRGGGGMILAAPSSGTSCCEAAYVSAAFGIGVVLIARARGGRLAARPGPRAAGIRAAPSSSTSSPSSCVVAHRRRRSCSASTS